MELGIRALGGAQAEYVIATGRLPSGNLHLLPLVSGIRTRTLSFGRTRIAVSMNYWLPGGECQGATVAVQVNAHSNLAKTTRSHSAVAPLTGEPSTPKSNCAVTLVMANRILVRKLEQVHGDPVLGERHETASAHGHFLVERYGECVAHPERQLRR